MWPLDVKCKLPMTKILYLPAYLTTSIYQWYRNPCCGRSRCICSVRSYWTTWIQVYSLTVILKVHWELCPVTLVTNLTKELKEVTGFMSFSSVQWLHWISGSQARVCVQITEPVLKPRLLGPTSEFWLSRSILGLIICIFLQVSRGCWCCWLEDCVLGTSGLNTSSKVLWFCACFPPFFQVAAPVLSFGQCYVI